MSKIEIPSIEFYSKGSEYFLEYEARHQARLSLEKCQTIMEMAIRGLEVLERQEVYHAKTVLDEIRKINFK